jgi:uncharacterized protein (TIGR03118 family)
VAQTNLISNGNVPAGLTDTSCPANTPTGSCLANPWGISHSPTSPFWISDNGTGVTTLYNGTGQPFPLAKPLVVTIPPPKGAQPPSSPTGQAFNTTTDFSVQANGKSAPSVFLFSTEDGTISGWAPSVDPTNAILAIDHSKQGTGAVYKGMTLFTDDSGSFLLAANFRRGRVEVYDANFHFVRSFRDHRIPDDFGPFNVLNLNGSLYVTYAKQLPGGHDDQAGPGNGFVERVDIFGFPRSHVRDRDDLNSPWGLVIAPKSFGRLAGSLLVGNFGDGRIHAFDRRHLGDLGTLKTGDGKDLVIDGLWGLITGNGGNGGDTDKVYFTAGPNGEKDGLFGSLTYTPEPGEEAPESNS